MEDQMYILMAKVLQGEATAAEQATLEAWLAEDVSHPGIYDQMKELWANADALKEQPQFDSNAAWNKFASKINFENAQTEVRESRVIAFPAWLRYSTAVAAVLVIAILIWNPFAGNEIRIAATDKNMNVVLPDQSMVTLRKGSSLSYPKKFATDERKVALKGEAFFEVTHNEQQPFIVDGQSVSVRVLGTSFDVLCSEQKADVSVATGKVQVSSKAQHNLAVILTPGNKVHFENGDLKPSFMNGFESAWRKDTLHFNGTPLSTVFLAISNAKDTTVTAANLTAEQLAQAITISLPLSQSVEDMLTELCLITHCRWERRGASYLIRTK